MNLKELEMFWKILIIIIFFPSYFLELPYVLGKLIAPVGETEMARMFLETRLVPTMLPKVPPEVLHVTIGQHGRDVDSIISRPHIDSKGLYYSNEYPNDDELVRYFYIQADIVDFETFIVKLIVNKYWKVKYFHKIYCPLLRRRTTHIGIVYDIIHNTRPVRSFCQDPGYYSYEYTDRDRSEALPIREHGKYIPLDCKFLGEKRAFSVTVFLFGEHERWADVGYYEQYNDFNRRSKFNIKKFLENVSGKVTHGASIKNICDRAQVYKMCLLLLPFVIFICLICFMGVIHTLYIERLEYLAEKKAQKI